MTGKPEDRARCAFCGGSAKWDRATIPFVSGKSVLVVRDVPAYICEDCGEPFMAGNVVDVVTRLLEQAKSLGADLSMVTYAEEEDGALLPR